MSYNELIWEESIPPVYGNFIWIPTNVLLWRGYDTSYPAISDRPSYFGARHTAAEYAKKPGRTLGCFATRRRLKLLDVRFMTVLLRDLFVKASNEHVLMDDILNVSLAFGICSFPHQVQLLKIRYRDNLAHPGIRAMIDADRPHMLEMPGVRIGETTNDGYVMAFLKELFSDFVDGFFSPRLHTPYHVEKSGTLNPEIILFRPSDCDIEQLTSVPKQRMLQSIIHLVERENTIITLGVHMLTTRIAMPHTGGEKHDEPVPAIEQFNDLLNANDPEATALYTKGETDGKRWKSYYMREYTYAPHPEYKVSPWILDAEMPPSRKRTKTRKLPRK